MSSYAFTFTKNIISTDAFYFTITQKSPNIDIKYFDYTADSTGAANGATIYTTKVLSTEELATLTTLVMNYTDPLYYFPGKYGILNNPIRTVSTNSTTPKTVYSWIYPGQLNVLGAAKGPGGVVNELKTLVQYDIEDISTATSITNPVVYIEIYDSTRNISIVSEYIDSSSVLNDWAIRAAAGATGPATDTHSTMFYDMFTKSPNYDVIWNLIVTVSDPRLTITLNTLQYICYNQAVYVNPADNPNGQTS
jgi:hypothetical protein